MAKDKRSFWQNVAKGAKDMTRLLTGAGTSPGEQRQSAKDKRELEKRIRQVQQESAERTQIYGAKAQQAYKDAREGITRHWQDASGKSGSGGVVQYIDGEVVVNVVNGYSRDYDCYTTDIVIAPRDGTGHRLHVVYDEQGREILNEWHTS